MLIIAIPLLILLHGFCDGANVLFVPAHLGPSHKKSIRPFAEALGKHGHNVTIWNIWYDHEPMKSKFFHDRTLILGGSHPSNTSDMDMIFWKIVRSDVITLTFPWMMSLMPCETAIAKHRTAFDDICAENWDLIIYDSLFTPCAYLLAQICNTTVASISTLSVAPSTQIARGMPSGLQYNPTFMSAIDADRGFWGRLERTTDYLQLNVFYHVFAFVQWRWFGSPYHQYSVNSFENDGSILALATYSPVMDWPVPSMADVIMVGGEQCDKNVSTALEEPFATFVNDPNSKGTIVAAFGHAIKWSKAPQYALDAFFDAFDRLSDYRIIWQYPGGRRLKKPSHIMFVDWLPQPALLNHAKTVAFLSHMGGKSTTEALCANVPVLALPMFAEQPRNSMFLKRAGSGITVNKFKLTASLLYDGLSELARNQSFYRHNARKWATYVAESGPISQAEFGSFWVGFALRHKHAMHTLYTQGRWLNFFVYYSLDNMFLVVLCSILTFSIM